MLALTASDLLQDVWRHLGISWGGVLAVVVATVVLYLVYTAILQVSGPRLMSSPSAWSFALVAVLGALAARAVLVEGRVVPEALRWRRLSEAQLLSRLRVAGAHRLRDVALVMLERRGGLTVIRTGDQVDAALIHDVDGKQLVPPYLLTDEGRDSAPGTSR